MSFIRASFYLVLIIFLQGTVLMALEMPLKEIVRITPHRENQLTGFGVVIGLSGTGDTRAMLARESLQRLLEKRGIPLNEKTFRSRNIAAVYVMASIPPFSRPGDAIDIWVSSLADARSLKGGFLPQTPLYASDGTVYAVAQGSLAKYTEEGARRSSRRQNTFRIQKGGIMEKKVVQNLFLDDIQNPPRTYLQLTPNIYDLTTNEEIVKTINKKGPYRARVTTDGTISVMFPDKNTAHSMAAEMLQLKVNVNTPARVVIDSRNGTIVMGKNVGISSVAISRGDISVKTNIYSRYYGYEDEEKKPALRNLEESATVVELVDALNKSGASIEEIINILKSIYAAGALQAELVIL